ncbi:hypothetical protein JM18_006109 [Phytophthora kernoviae]|uniref:PIPK domain-containing protein n=1 Tax=Phytophthora kernoviae TaxID=325452 RepID=A0A921V5N7_9STRA|nr:hypothetical protein JM18_006109 [Phytophthora kernoviae]
MSDNDDLSLTGADCPTGSVVLPVLTSVASLIGCFYVVGTYWRVRALRHHPAGIMFGMSVYGAIYQFLYLLNKASTEVQCTDIGIIVDFFLTGQETYMLIFAIDLLLALKNPFSTAKGQMTKYHIFGGVWSLVCAVISHYDTHYALFGFCWIGSSDEILNRPRNENTPDNTLTTGVFFAFYIAVVYCTSLIAIVRTWNTFKKGLPDTFVTRRRTQRHLKYYVGCYFGYWTLVLGCYALFSLLPQARPGHDGGYRCRVWHLLSCLLLAKGMVHALIWTRTSNILKIIEQLREFGTIDLPEHDDNINWALRREILTNTTKGICESVDNAERQARASAASSFRSVSGSSLEEGLGVESSSVQKDYCDRKESYTQIEEVILVSQSDHNSEGVVFKDFAPHVFRRLREEAKISSARYRNSFNQTTMERVSEGKSGAFFYFTEDRKYVVKTLTNEELKFLLSILPQYYTFMKTHPDTFMTRFFGCHGLTMYGKTVFFVVMQSVFASSLQIHERFDLKGSWVGRIEGRKPTGTIATCKYCSAEYTVGSHDQHCNVRGGVLRHQYDQTGKDLNWNRHMALPISTAHRHGISVVNPRQYAERFQQRVITELIYDAASAPARELVDDISLTQLRRQNQRNAELVESGRTMSTMLASREGDFAPTTSPFTPPMATSVTPKTDAISRPIAEATGTRHHVSCSWDNGYRNSGGIGRLSGGFVMEIPGTSPSFPTALDTLPPHDNQTDDMPSSPSISTQQSEGNYKHEIMRSFMPPSDAEMLERARASHTSKDFAALAAGPEFSGPNGPWKRVESAGKFAIFRREIPRSNSDKRPPRVEVMCAGRLKASLEEVVSILRSSSESEHNTVMEGLYAKGFIFGSFEREVPCSEVSTSKLDQAPIVDSGEQLAIKTKSFARAALFAHNEQWCYSDYFQREHMESAAGRVAAIIVCTRCHANVQACEYAEVFAGTAAEREKHRGPARVIADSSGFPLTVPAEDGLSEVVVGTLCCIDTKPRAEITRTQYATIKRLASTAKHFVLQKSRQLQQEQKLALESAEGHN